MVGQSIGVPGSQLTIRRYRDKRRDTHRGEWVKKVVVIPRQVKLKVYIGTVSESRQGMVIRHE